MSNSGHPTASVPRPTGFRDDHDRRAGRTARRPGGPVYAALDLGTNNCRLLAARLDGAGFRVIDSFSRIVRLGEGLSVHGRLDDGAIERTLAALRICSGKLKRLGVKRSRCVATEACRRAANSGEFLARVEADTGLRFEPISAAEEARLTVAGCVPLFERGARSILMFDIGGGSTEATWIDDADGGPPRILGTLSIPIGVMTVAETYGTGTLSENDVADLRTRVDTDLARFDAEHGIAARIKEGGVQMLGTSGTVTTLGGIHLDLPRYDRARVDGLTVPFDGICAVIERLASLSVEERAASPCVGWQRADLMAAGCALLKCILDRWPVGRLTVADRGLREGILLEMMAADGAGALRARLPARPAIDGKPQ